MTPAERFLIAQRDTDRTACARYLRAHNVDDDNALAVEAAKAAYRAQPILLDPEVASLSRAALIAARGPAVTGTTPFPVTIYFGGATDTHRGVQFTSDFDHFVEHVLVNRSTDIAEKRQGWVVTPVTSKTGERKNADTVSVNALNLDCFPLTQKIICRSKLTGMYELVSLGQLQLAYDSYEALSYNFETNKQEFKPIVNFFDKGVRPVTRMHLSNGADIDATNDHTFWTIDGGKQVPPYKDSYRVGQRTMGEFAENYAAYRTGKISKAIWKLRSKVVVASKIPALNLGQWSDAQAYLAGIYAAEGCFSSGMNSIGQYKPEIRQRIETCLNELGIEFRYDEGGRDGKHKSSGAQYRLLAGRKPGWGGEYNEMVAWLRDEFGNTKSDSTHFPQAMLSSSESTIRHMLDAHGDGDAWRPRKDVQYRSARKAKTTRAEHSTISNRLAEEIRFSLLILGRSVYSYLQKHNCGRGWQPIWRITEHTDAHTRTAPRKSLCEKLGLRDLTYATVRSVKSVGEAHVGCIEVADNHNFFLADGTLVANCDGRGTPDAIRTELDSLGLAYMLYQSGGWTPTEPKWHLLLPLARPFMISGLPENWLKWRAAYATARTVLGALGRLLGEGFDPTVDAPSVPVFITERRRPEDPPRQVVWRHGASLDIHALCAALPVRPEEDRRACERAISEAAPLPGGKLDEIIVALCKPMSVILEGRRELYLALTGALLDRGVPPDDAYSIIEEVSRRCPGDPRYTPAEVDQKHREHLHGADTTIAKYEAGETYTRIGTLGERWPAVARAVDLALPDPQLQEIETMIAKYVAERSAPTSAPPLPAGVPPLPSSAMRTDAPAPISLDDVRKSLLAVRARKKRIMAGNLDEIIRYSIIDALIRGDDLVPRDGKSGALIADSSGRLVDRDRAIGVAMGMLAHGLPVSTPFTAVRVLALHALAATAGAEVPLADLVKIAENAFTRAVGRRVDRDVKNFTASNTERLSLE